MRSRRTTILVLAAWLALLAGCGRLTPSVEQHDVFAPTEITTLALPWSIETLDVTGWPSGPAAMAVGSDGTRHIAYIETIEDVLRYVSGQTGTWSDDEAVGIAQSGYLDGGSLSMAVGRDGVPRVAYLDGLGALAYAARADGVWPVAADVVNPYAVALSLAVADDGTAHLVFRDGSGMHHAVQTNDGWSVSTVLANPVSGSLASGAVTLDGEGRPRVAVMWSEWLSPTYWVKLGYTEATVDADGRLTWSPMTVVVSEANAGNLGTAALALDGADHPHIAYRSGYAQLRYVAHDGSSWGAPVVVDASDAFWPSIAVDGSGNAHIAYRVRPAGASGDTLRYAVSDDTGWRIDEVDGAGYAGAPAIVVDALDRPSIAYTLDTGAANELRYATVAEPVTDYVVTNGHDAGEGSLRQKILDAPAGTTITFAPEVTNVGLTSGPLALTKDVTIAGPAEGTVTVRGDGTFRIFAIGAEGVDVVLRSLTITGGRAPSYEGGGGVAVQWPDPTLPPPSLHLDRCTVTGNHADGGGGVFAQGILVIERSTLDANTATEAGGAVFFAGTDVDDASAPYPTRATILDSTITANASDRDGGGVYVFSGALRMLFSTVTSNTAGSFGGGVASYNDEHTRTTMKGSIVVGNVGYKDYDDVHGVSTGNPYDSLGYNVIGFASGTVDFASEFVAFGDVQGMTVDGIGLQPLAANGGPTLTHALSATSEMVDSVLPDDCTDLIGAALTTDQRGVARPQGWACDPGAFEVEGGALMYLLSVAVVPDLSGSVEGDGMYQPGATAKLTAIPATHWQFSHWSGDHTGSENPATFTMDAPKTVVANFVQRSYDLVLTVTDGGAVDLDPPEGPYPYGTTVILTATADPGWHFAGWSGDLGGDATPATLTMDAPKSVAATFAKDAGIELLVTVQGSGEVTRDPAGPYAAGDVVTLTAIPAQGWFFQTWIGDLTGSENPTTLTIAEGLEITAVFQRVGPLLTVSVEGDGRVTSSPAGLDCGPDGGDCTASFKKNTNVTLFAVPGPSSVFLGWSGAASSSATSVTLRMNADKTVTASFREQNGPIVVIDPTATLRAGSATVTGTLVCGADFHDLEVSLVEEVQVSKTVTKFVVASATIFGVPCGQPWRATLTPVGDRFVRGAATLTVTVAGLPTAVTVQLR